MQGWRFQQGLACLFLGLAGMVPMATAPSGQAFAQIERDTPEGFLAFREELRRAAAAEGVSAATLESVIPEIRFIPRVVALDQRQPGGAPDSPIPDFEPYRLRHVDRARIDRGRARYAALRPVLERVERETGVPESIMLAIYGHETNYGAYTGNFDLPNALASLAFEGRRRELFTQEFIAALLMIDSGIARDRLRGSWAGATGYPQFLPSAYLRWARDGDGDGKADIWRNEVDALASIANYFVQAGWKRGVKWGTAVSVPEGLDWRPLQSRLAAPNCARVHGRLSRWKSVAEWRAMGVIPSRNDLPDYEQASLFQPDGPGTPAWLLTGNYRVILEYNCSNFYALSVGLLADAVEIGGQG